MKLIGRRGKSGLLGLFASLLFSIHASALWIDDFTQGLLAPTSATNIQGQTILQGGLTPSQVFGGARSVYVGSLGFATVSTDTIKGRFFFQARTNFGYFQLDWAPTDLFDVDLSGNNQFRLGFVDSSFGNSLGFLNLRVRSGNTWFSAEIRGDLDSALSQKTFGEIAIHFNRFAGADFTRIQAIQLEGARLPQGTHLTFDHLSVVPEPTLGTLLLLGFGSTWRTRQRR